MTHPQDHASGSEHQPADHGPERALGRLTALLAAICGAPIAFIALPDGAQQRLVAVQGADWPEVLESRACRLALAQAEGLVVEDARLDPRFGEQPLVDGAADLRFFAGLPLFNAAGETLGTIAVLDRGPRQLDGLQLQALHTLAGQAVLGLDALERQRERAQHRAALQDSEQRWRMLFEHNPLAMWIFDLESLRFLAVNDAAVAQYGWSAGEFKSMTIKDIRPAQTVPDLMEDLAEGHHALHGGRLWRHLRKNGELLWVDIIAHSVEFEGRPCRLILAHDVTARVRALEALREGEARWQRLFAASAIGIASATLDGRFASANPAFCALVGRSPAEVLGQPLLGFTDPRDLDACQQGIACITSGELDTLSLEKRYVRPDGRSVWARAALTLTSAPEGSGTQARQVVAVVQDIDAQRAAEQALQRNGALLELAGRLAGVGGWAVDLPTMNVRWSDELRLIFDVPTGELPDVETALSWYSEASRPRIEQALQACLSEGRPFDVDVDMTTAAGRPLAVRVIGRPLLDAEGRLLGASGAVLDQTAHKAAERRLRTSEERFRHAARATADAIWDWNLADDSRWWGEGMQSLFGHARADLPPGIAHWLALIHPDDRVRVEGGVRAAIAGGEEQWRAEYRFQRSNGEYARVLDRGFVVRSETGQALRMVGGMTDLTERYALEAQLQQAQRLEAVGQLTGGVAHDFNNLLTVILGNAELLVEQLADRPMLQSLAQMSVTAAERGAELTQRLLAFARKQALQPQPVDAHQLLAGMDALLRRTLPSHIDLELVRGAGLWPALADPVQLESALLNLVLNARDAMPEGGRLTLETANAWIDQDYADRHADVLPGQYVQLSVSDTGSGMTPAQLARAFEPFYTTKAVGKGTGMGLSMVYGYAKQSRGHVKLYSEPGHGTTVRLYLPRAPVAAVAAAAGVGKPVLSHLDNGLRGSATVLVVEDDELVRRHAADALVALGYTVLVAENGVAGLALLRERADIDLLFTDVVMPGGMNGRQLAEAALALRPGLKVLYTSGYTENAIVHHGRLDRGVHLLPKPYRSLDLARKLRVVLESDA